MAFMFEARVSKFDILKGMMRMRMFSARFSANSDGGGLIVISQ